MASIPIWTRTEIPIRYPNAVWDEVEQRLVSDAEIAEVPFTAFTGRRKGEQITGWLLMGRVKRLDLAGKSQADKTMTAGQQELFATYRYPVGWFSPCAGRRGDSWFPARRHPGRDRTCGLSISVHRA